MSAIIEGMLEWGANDIIYSRRINREGERMERGRDMEHRETFRDKDSR